MSKFVISIDQGTTSTRAIAFDLSGNIICSSQKDITITYPKTDWVEQDPNEIWIKTKECLDNVLSNAAKSGQAISIGITNQRETIVAWDRETGKAYYNAIVWQCKRSQDICKNLKDLGLESKIQEKTGLLLDPYFSASKIKWLIDNVEEVGTAVKNNKVYFGTIDSWLIYNISKLNGLGLNLTEASNASRTMLYNINTNDWDLDLLEIFSIPKDSLAKVINSNSDFTSYNWQGLEIKVNAVLGDQQASLYGHSCLELNDAKCTFGTGAFLLCNSESIRSSNESRLLTSKFYKTNDNSPLSIEGSIFLAGTIFKFLVENLGLAKSINELDLLAQKRFEDVSILGEVIFIPSMVGLGAPYWRPDLKACFTGLSLSSTKSDIALSAYLALAHQVRDLLDISEFSKIRQLKIDGGVTRSLFFCQILSDICQIEILKSSNEEVTSLGVAKLSIESSFHDNQDAIDKFTNSSLEYTVFKPKIDKKIVKQARDEWLKTIKNIINWK